MEKITLNKARIGARSELIAAAWLMARGYEVFRNMSPEGPFDIIAVSPEHTLYIDVKTPAARWNYGVYCLQAGQVRPSAAKYSGIKVSLLYVYEGQVAWKIGELPAPVPPEAIGDDE